MAAVENVEELCPELERDILSITNQGGTAAIVQIGLSVGQVHY
jgi:hypothetical protein